MNLPCKSNGKERSTKSINGVTVQRLLDMFALSREAHLVTANGVLDHGGSHVGKGRPRKDHTGDIGRMKCRVCGKQANIRLPQYNTALCGDDFIGFFEKRVLSTIGKYGLMGEEDKTLVAVSGGKDSLSLWHLLDRLGFSADGIYIDLGIQGLFGCLL